MSYIKLIDILRRYGDDKVGFNALNKLNLTIEKGEMIAILGASGSGKSTLLNIIGCLDKCTSGKVLFDEKDITNYSEKELAIIRNSKIGFIFQNFSLFNEYTVAENVEVPLLYRNLLLKNERLNKKKIKELVEKYLREVGLEDCLNKKVTQLSGGQQQRVAIARALVSSPNIILADEPTGALDKKNALNIINLLKDINEKINTTILIVTHDEQIASHCNRIIKIEDGMVISDSCLDNTTAI